MNASFEKIVCDLRALGVKAGDVLLVHSSLKSMGHVEGGAETVIAALRAVLGEVSLAEPEVLAWVRGYLSEQYEQLPE